MAMHRLLHILRKEYCLLARDRAGLLVLFAMPALLVVIITLVQENVLELSGQRPAEVVFWDRDQGPFASSLRHYLGAADLDLIDRSGEDEQALRREILAGTHQAGVFLAKGASEALTRSMRSLGEDSGTVAAAVATSPRLELVFDPAAMAGYRAGLHGRIRMAAMAAETDLQAALLGQMLAASAPPAGSEANDAAAPIRRLGNAFGKALVEVRETATHGHGIEEIFNPVNQNVPAWALFGMFFTAIPIAGSMIEERRTGIAARLAAMPAPPLLLLVGRTLAYLGVCCCQFGLIVLVGRYLFPHLGLPAFTPAQPLAMVLLVLLCGLAAASFGAVLGALARSYEQASMLGSTMVVTAAALGGVMVPVYAMPRTMQAISQASPFNWAISAFTEILTRGGGIRAIAGHGLALVLFSTVLLLVAWQRNRN